MVGARVAFLWAFLLLLLLAAARTGIGGAWVGVSARGFVLFSIARAPVPRPVPPFCSRPAAAAAADIHPFLYPSIPNICFKTLGYMAHKHTQKVTGRAGKEGEKYTNEGRPDRLR